MAGFLKKLFGNDNAKSGDGGGAGLTEPDLTIERARNEMQLRTQAAIGLWGMDQASWAVDLETGIITFTNAEKGWVIAAPVQVVGTFNTEDDTWLWGWDHPSVPDPVGEHARLVHDFGEKYGLEAMTTRKIAATMAECWDFTALACHLAGAEGGYSGPAGTARVFMTFGTVSIKKGE
jgi:hypothetical protein